MPEIDLERQQELLDEIAQAEAVEDAARRAVIDSNTELQSAREHYQGAVAVAQAELEVVVAQHRRVEKILDERRAWLYTLKTELKRVRHQFDG